MVVTSAREDELQVELQKFYTKWKDFIDGLDSLPEPCRSIAGFVKKECVEK